MSNQEKTPMDDVGRVTAYQRIVSEYEALDQEIDALIMKYDGASKNMPEDVLTHYRELARRRWDLRNEMRILEASLFEEDE